VRLELNVELNLLFTEHVSFGLVLIMTLHYVTSRNGKKLIQFAQMHDMFAVRTKMNIKRYIETHA